MDTTENLYLEGDNFEVLKILQESYLGKVKMIYIDPPYNTGNDFIYSDKFKVSKIEYEDDLNTTNEEGEKLYRNTDTNGRFHSDWLSMIYERLIVAKELLKNDGVFFISIDDNEVHNLRKICDEIFGEENFVAQFIWAAGRKNDSQLVSVSHEYIISYVKNKDYLKELNAQWRTRKVGLEDIYKTYRNLKKKYTNDYFSMTKDLKEWFKNLPDNHTSKRHKHYSLIDKEGVYFPDNLSWPGGGGPKYDVLHPLTKKPCKIPTRGWLFSKSEKMVEMIRESRIHFGEDETSVPCFKSYLIDREEEVPYSVFYQDGRAATKRLRALMGGDYFDHPKDEMILLNLIEACTGEGDIVMDFFSGSGTLAHSLFLANVKQNIARPFLLVQLQEKLTLEKETGKRKKLIDRSIKFLDSIGLDHNIAEIAKERIRRAGKVIIHDSIETNKKKKTEGDLFNDEENESLSTSTNTKELDVGFRVYKVDSSNMKDIYYHPETIDQDIFESSESNIKSNRTPDDLLTQVILDLGLELNLPIEKKIIHDNTIFIVQTNALVACFDEQIDFKIIDDIAEIKPYKVVFKDACFKDDKDRINVEERFKRLSPDTIITVL